MNKSKAAKLKGKSTSNKKKIGRKTKSKGILIKVKNTGEKIMDEINTDLGSPINLMNVKGGKKAKFLKTKKLKKLKKSKGKSKGKSRGKSKYNIFMKKELARLKKDPSCKSKNHKEIFKMAARNWKK
tara:strand:+ start:16 stop:396 length:381 start_codon:yes stop_codon:yes gene_type:complete